MTEYQAYFTVIGRLRSEESDSFQVLPLFRKSRQLDFDRLMAEESDMHAVLFDEAGDPFLEVPLSYASYCSDTEKTDTIAVRGYLPDDERTRGIRYEFRGRVIDEVRVPKAKPRVELVTRLPERVNGEALVLSWESVYEGEGTLQYKVLYSNTGGESWQRVGDRTFEPQMRIDTTNLPGGKDCQFAVFVTDGYNTASDKTDRFQVLDKPVEAMILDPLPGDLLSAGRSVLLNGQGYNPNTGELVDDELRWFSSRDGELGKGALVQAQLSEGEHRISLQIAASEAEVVVRVT